MPKTAVRERPILFSAAMVRAILEGRKTQTRRIVKVAALQTHWDREGWRYLGTDASYQHVFDHPRAIGSLSRLLCPYGKPGDRLWVRETYAFIDNSEFGEPSYCQYRADTDGKCLPGDWPDESRGAPRIPKWKSSMFMPRKFSRVTLELCAVHVERLQDISEADVIAEGVQIPVEKISQTPNIYWRVSGKFPPIAYMPNDKSKWTGELAYRAHYASLWESINGADSWAANPWVWVLSFKCVDAASVASISRSLQKQHSRLADPAMETCIQPIKGDLS